GAGSPLPGAGYYVVYAGTGTSVTVTNLSYNTSYNAAVFSYLGSGGSISYNRNAPKASLFIPPNKVVAQANVQQPDVQISFSANPGKWYWLQFTDTLSPPNWQQVGTAPVLANSAGMAVVHVNGALATQRFYRLEQL